MENVLGKLLYFTMRNARLLSEPRKMSSCGALIGQLSEKLWKRWLQRNIRRTDSSLKILNYFVFLNFIYYIYDWLHLENLTPLQKDSLAGALSTLKYKKDQTIVTEGEPGSSYYIIKNVSISLILIFFPKNFILFYFCIHLKLKKI